MILRFIYRRLISHLPNRWVYIYTTYAFFSLYIPPSVHLFSATLYRRAHMRPIYCIYKCLPFCVSSGLALVLLFYIGLLPPDQPTYYSTALANRRAWVPTKVPQVVIRKGHYKLIFPEQVLRMYTPCGI